MTKCVRHGQNDYEHRPVGIVILGNQVQEVEVTGEARLALQEALLEGVDKVASSKNLSQNWTELKCV